MRQRYVKNRETGEYEWVTVRRQPPRPALAPAIRTDSIPRHYCHGTGMWHDSRSERDAMLRASGTEAVGTNYETPDREGWQDNSKEIERDLQETANDIRWGMNGELTADEKAECKRIDERLRSDTRREQ